MNNNIQQLLNIAKFLCNQRSVKLTPQRLEVLRLIYQQKKATSAYDLLDKLKKSIPHAKPITIYRALNFLLNQKLIHRVESTNKFMICHHPTEPSHAFVFFICNNCNIVIEQNIIDIKNILYYAANLLKFKIIFNIIETHGFCKQCRSNNISIK